MNNKKTDYIEVCRERKDKTYFSKNYTTDTLIIGLLTFFGVMLFLTTSQIAEAEQKQVYTGKSGEIYFKIKDRPLLDRYKLKSLFEKQIEWESDQVRHEDFIAKFEGFEPCAYKDLGGGYSIGYGTKAKSATECITEKTAKLRLREKIIWIDGMLRKKFPKLNHNQRVVLTDVVFNVRPKNLGYIYHQVAIAHPVRQEKELTYALWQMSCSRITPTSPCVHHGGLFKRYNARIKLFFNK